MSEYHYSYASTTKKEREEERPDLLNSFKSFREKEGELASSLLFQFHDSGQANMEEGGEIDFGYLKPGGEGGSARHILIQRLCRRGEKEGKNHRSFAPEESSREEGRKEQTEYYALVL